MNIRQIIAAESGWSVVIAEQTRDEDGHSTGPAEIHPLVGWALTGDGMVEALFPETGSSHAVTPSYYRQMHHDCGDGYSVTHRIVVVPREDSHG